MNIIRNKLSESSQLVLVFYGGFAAFLTYFSMYAFRKPFSVGTYESALTIPILGEIDYKIILIIAQVMGYTLSKFVGIKIVSETGREKRAVTIFLLIIMAELSLFLFGLVPRPWHILCIFLNGLPLGMIWGLVFGFLEGRRTSEALGAILSASYIVSSGFVKSAGKMVIHTGISEYWMPFITGLFFLPLLGLSLYLLNQIPDPTEEDEKARVHRQPMKYEDRVIFLKTYLPGIIPLTFLYMFLTAYRDFRDNFAREIWDALGFGGQPMIFTWSEIPVTVAVLVIMALIMFIRNNDRAFFSMLGIMIGGTALIGISTFLHQAGLISPASWMVLNGIGLYAAYVPFGCFLFDRMIAAVGFMGTAGFMIYVADAFGYLGSVMLLLYKNFGSKELTWLSFFNGFSYITSIVGVTFFIIGIIYFKRKRIIKES